MSDNNLIVKQSQIKEAGLGLYTLAPIKKNQVICEFTGELISSKQLEKLLKKRQLRYLIEITDDYSLNVEKSSCLAKYANDAEGGSKIIGIENNAEIWLINNRAFIAATKPIKANEEIFLSYGSDYWENI